jgi:adenosylcobinamide-GDP ribazoletransferase
VPAVRNRFLTVFTLISRIPVRARFEADFSRADLWIPALSPLVSAAAAIGAALGLYALGSSALAAFAALAIQYLCFNLFHLDGLLDSADALLPHASQERRLEILKDSRIGSFALFAGVLVLGSKLVAMGLLFDSGPLPGLAAILAWPLAGRFACALVPLLSQPAKEGGLGALMRGFSAARVILGFAIGALPLAALALILGNIAIFVAAAASTIVAGPLSAALLARLYAKRVGGFTGDALGVAVELGELFSVLFMVAGLRLLAWVGL